jgi:hypothetical protein
MFQEQYLTCWLSPCGAPSTEARGYTLYHQGSMAKSLRLHYQQQTNFHQWSNNTKKKVTTFSHIIHETWNTNKESQNHFMWSTTTCDWMLYPFDLKE